MRNKICRISAVLLALLLSVSLLTACGEGISGDEAKALTNDFFTALSAGDHTAAAALFHPNAKTTADEVSAFCASLKDTYGVDVTQGMTVEKYTGFSTSLYDSSVGGARYELTMDVTVGETSCSFTTEVVRNDAGYGLFNIYFND